MKPLLALAALALLAPTAAAALEAVHDVRIQGTQYNPRILQISVGDTVRWTQLDNFLHTVSATDGSFQSGDLVRGQTFSHTFTSPGVVPYQCMYHPFMIAAIIVT